MSETNDAGATTASETGGTPSAFDDEFAAFLGHTFGDPNAEPEAPVLGGPETSAPAAAAAEPAAPASTPLAVAPASAETPAANGEAAPPQDPAPSGIDPADLAAMVGLATPKAPATAEPAAESAPAPASSSSEEDAPWTPFTPTFKLPPETVSALFEAEDTETRAAALVGLLASFGNTLTQVVDERIAKHHAPRIQSSFDSSQNEQQTARAIFQDFYGKYTQLDAYRPAVQKAFQIVAQKTGMKEGYTPAIRDQVAALAIAALKQSGVVFEEAPATVPPKEVVKATPSKAPGSGFEAGSARPSGQIETGDNGAADLVAELSQF